MQQISDHQLLLENAPSTGTMTVIWVYNVMFFSFVICQVVLKLLDNRLFETLLFQWGGDKSVNLKKEVNKRQNNTRLQPWEQRLKLHNSIFVVHLFHSQNVRSLNFNNYVCISVMLLFANLLYLFDWRRVRNSLLIISHPTG